MKKSLLFLLAILFGVNFLHGQIIHTFDFESWQNNHPTGWNGTYTALDDSCIFQSSQSHSGNYSLEVQKQTLTEHKYISTNSFYLAPEKAFQISVWAKGKGDMRIGAYYCNESFTAIYRQTAMDTSDWVEHKFWFFTYGRNDSTCIEFCLGFANIQAGNSIIIDDIKINELDEYSKVLDINNLKARIFADGALFNNSRLYGRGTQHTSTAGLLIPYGDSLKATIYKGNLWIGALNQDNNLCVSSESYYDNVFSYGPITNDYTDENYINKYNRVWKISKDEINYHRNNYNTSGYSMPDVISSWPGNGGANESDTIAPYCDVNNNGIYDPESGDYPAIRGDQALFFVINDVWDRNTSVFGNGLGLQIRGMAFAYLDPTNEDLKNTMFISYEIRNLSPNNYTNTYLGLFNDIEIGYGLDDYMGFDSTLNMMYAYNGKLIDGPGEGAYSGMTPVQGEMLLNHSASKFIVFENSTNEFIGVPRTKEHFYNYLSGKKLNGLPITYGENALNDTNSPTNFMYTGYPELNIGWSELSNNNTPMDRRGISSFGPFDLNSGEKICLDIAFPYALDNSATTPQGSLPLLRQRAQNIKTFYDSKGFECGFNDLAIKEVSSIKNNIFSLYPNPNSGKFILRSQELVPDSRIEIYSIIGNKIYTKDIYSTNQDISLDIRSGVYTYRIISKEITIKQGKIIISK